MSISTIDTSTTFTGNNSTSTEYQIPFKYLDSSHLKVVGVFANGGELDISATCSYTGDGSNLTGSFTTQDVWDGTSSVRVELDMPLDQPVVLQELGMLPAKTIEVQGFDRLNMQIRSVWGKMQASVGNFLSKGDNVSDLANDAGYLTGIADNSIGTAQIVNGAIDSNKIKNSSIFLDDLGAGIKASLASADSSVQSVTAGTNVTIDNTDPANPVVSSTATAGGGTVQGTGATTRNIRAVDEGTVAGNARGEGSVDLQTDRVGATQVASGIQSTIIGGIDNTAGGTQSVAFGAQNNTGTGVRSAILGGISNDITSSGSNNAIISSLQSDITGIQSQGVVIGGNNHDVSGSNAGAFAGQRNIVSGTSAVALGGSDSQATQVDSLVAGDNGRAIHVGARVFADSSDTDFPSIIADEFAIQGSALRLDDGNQGSGKILTCDANGSGNWADAPAGGSGGTVQGTGATTLNIRAADEGTVAGDARGEYSVDLQLNRNAVDQVASGLYSAIIGGRRNKATANNSAIVGGIDNSTTANDSFISGNTNSNASARGAVVGGISNAITGTGSNHVIVGGISNAITATTSHAGVFAGNNNTVTAGNSASLGGQRNTIGGANSVALGATDGITSANDTLIAGGDATASHLGSRVFGDNTATPIASIANNEFAIQGSALRLVDGNQGSGKVLTCDVNGSGNWVDLPAGGSGGTVQGTDAVYDIQATNEGAVAGNVRGENSVDLQTLRANVDEVASGTTSSIIGGIDNRASGGNSTVLGGQDNIASAYATLAAGRVATAGDFGARVFGDGTSTGISSLQPHEFAVQASALRLVDGNQGAGKVLTSDLNGSGNWVDLPAGNNIGGTVQGTNGVYDIRAVDEGAFASTTPRGESSVDLQTSRNTVDQVASGITAVLIGGTRNTASGDRAACLSGFECTASGDFSVSLGGRVGVADANYSLVAGFKGLAGAQLGARVFADSTTAGITARQPEEFAIQASALRLEDGNEAVGKVLTCNHADGSSNWADLPAGYIGGTVQGTGINSKNIRAANEGGLVGNARGENSVDLQLNKNAVDQVASGVNSVVIAGANNKATNNGSAVIGGVGNTSSAYTSFIGGGENNTASISGGVVLGGEGNSAITGSYSAVVAGNNNAASGLSSFIGGGTNNTATAQYAGVIGGATNAAQGNNSFVMGGYGNIASGARGTVIMGANSTASGDDSLVVGNACTASHKGARMIGDGTVTAFASKATHEFGVQADNIRLDVGTPVVGDVLTCNHVDGSSSWAAPAKVVYTVATLPATPAQGDVAMVTDATANTFHSVVAGTGSNIVPVFFDGTNWRIG